MNTDQSNVLQESSAVILEPHEESSAEAVLAEQMGAAERIAAAPLFIP